MELLLKSLITHVGLKKTKLLLFVALLCCSIALILWTDPFRASAQEPTAQLISFHRIYPNEWAMRYPYGMAYASTLNKFFVAEVPEATESGAEVTLLTLSPYEDVISRTTLSLVTDDGISLAYDEVGQRLLIANRQTNQLAEVKLNSEGVPDPATLHQYDLKALNLAKVDGLDVDANSHRLYFLESATPKLVSLPLDSLLSSMNGVDATVASVIKLTQFKQHKLRGLAIHPTSHHLYLVSRNNQRLLELDQAGQLQSDYSLEEMELWDPRDLKFAPSPDLTDDPQTIHLFAVDSGYKRKVLTASDNGENVEEIQDPTFTQQTFLPMVVDNRPGLRSVRQAASPQSNLVINNNDENDDAVIDAITGKPIRRMGAITEMGWVDPALQAANADALIPLFAVRIVNMFKFSPASPDPSGITYLPDSDQLLVSDAEVDEMPLFLPAKKNLFFLSRTGDLLSTGTSQPTTSEPAGVGAYLGSNRFFYSDDNLKRVFEMQPGFDGVIGTNDDRVVRSFSTVTFGSHDPEGVTFDPSSGELLIADGVNNEIYRINPGSNGVFNGPPPSGDDIVTSFDTLVNGITDPESVEFNATNNSLVVVSDIGDRLFEVSPSGILLRTFDTAEAAVDKPAGIAMAPASDNSGTQDYYLVARGIDNNTDPNENDGKLYEFSLLQPTPTPGPPAREIFLSISSSSSSVAGLKFKDEDVIANNLDTDGWRMYFDGSDVDFIDDIDEFEWLNDGSMLFSIGDDGINIPGIGPVDDSDIMRFIPNSIGSITAGTFEMYFDGSDVELETSGEDVDGIALAPDGRLLLSTKGSFHAQGLSGKGEDLMAFSPTQLGFDTSGTWSMYFDGSDVDLTTVATTTVGVNENVSAVWMDTNTNKLYFVTEGTFAVGSIVGNPSDVFACTLVTAGSNTACTWDSSLYWVGSAHGFAGQTIDGLYVRP